MFAFSGEIVDKMLSSLANGPDLAFPQVWVIIIIVLLVASVLGAFRCIHEVVYTILVFLYAILCVVPNFILRWSGHETLPPPVVLRRNNSTKKAEKRSAWDVLHNGFHDEEDNPESKQ